ncbi:conserved hypothetical protein [Thermotomaculum hydrothermale]|uniref:Radical SAM core domain-containing protein n=1 Tax=Thermotomaculum hydrothermale TaxID=981385 RepID=A0A7R6SYG5_9BACT|nr:KamA family radical SAM protein [Thermotomaculum hydrothermale]BBB32536.1 conserved hypothetical protein [Thermotomaculum hydrothermale]
METTLGKKVNHITSISKIQKLSEEEIKKIEKITEVFGFRATDYYLSLINWDNPNDPIKRLIIPIEEELEKWGAKDPSYEKSYTVAPGLQHKYRETALFLIGPTCFGYCRFCFRKRLFMDDDNEILIDIEPAIQYIKEHKEIQNVLLTGGDPLTLSTNKLSSILNELAEIDHLINIRIGTKAPAFYPHRISNDPELLDLFKLTNKKGKRIHIVAQFDHGNEITPQAKKAINKMMETGCVMLTQMPLLKGINDSPEALSELWNKAINAGLTPYYLFQCRPTTGNKPYAVPIEEGYKIFEQAKMNCSGLAKRIKFVMSHATGKIEIVGLTEKHVIMKYHQAANPENIGKIMIFNRNPEAYWLDDYTELVEEYKIENPFI